MNICKERIVNGLLTENPTFILMLGMCPTLAVTTSLTNAIGIGVSTTAVLVNCNVVISLVRKLIPDDVRLPAFIVIAASFVTVPEMIMKAYFVELNASLGVYIPLIVVNCIILGRAEAYASKNPPLAATMDGIGMGLGFTVGLILISFFRELFGAGTLFGKQVMPAAFAPIGVLVKAPGAFLVLGLLVLLMNVTHINTLANKKVESCDGCCATCAKAAEEGKGGERA